MVKEAFALLHILLLIRAHLLEHFDHRFPGHVLQLLVQEVGHSGLGVVRRQERLVAQGFHAVHRLQLFVLGLEESVDVAK